MLFKCFTRILSSFGYRNDDYLISPYNSWSTLTNRFVLRIFCCSLLLLQDEWRKIITFRERLHKCAKRKCIYLNRWVVKSMQFYQFQLKLQRVICRLSTKQNMPIYFKIVLWRKCCYTAVATLSKLCTWCWVSVHDFHIK